MARVSNWQLGRDMAYWYEEARPKKQFSGIFDLNKCIACQTCSIACKTTWTSGKGQEYMFWNNVESKPYGFYPTAWDVKLLDMLGSQEWNGQSYGGKTVFESAPAGERVLGYQPNDMDYAHVNLGEDEVFGTIGKGAHFQGVHDMAWFYYLPRICNHCTYPACLAGCPRGSIYKRPEDGIVLVDQTRCRGYKECVKACPYKKVFYNPLTNTSEKCIACFPLVEQREQPRCFQTCIGKIRLHGWISTPDKAREDNPIDYLVHFKKLALPLFPQFGLEPNVYYVPPMHVPVPFLTQMFGPGAAASVAAYRSIQNDPVMQGLMVLFGSTPMRLTRFEVKDGRARGWTDGDELVADVPVQEPSVIRPEFTEFDKPDGSKVKIYRHNAP